MIEHIALSLATYFLVSPSPHLAIPPLPQSSHLSQSSLCSGNLETMIDSLIADLPGYGNRVIQRSRNLKQEQTYLSYILLAGRPEFEPLPLNQTQYTPTVPETTEQVFLTTKERSYWHDQIIETESYHWLFLTKTDQGWQLVMIFTQLGVNSSQEVPLPPRENSDGIMGQAVSLWLRDCHSK